MGSPAGPVELVTVHRGRREIGAFVLGSGRTTFVPAVDVTTVLLASLATTAFAAAALAVAVAVRRQPAVGSVSMGPGGWISIKGGVRPPLRAAASEPRPWWAHSIRAHRLVVQR